MRNGDVTRRETQGPPSASVRRPSLTRRLLWIGVIGAAFTVIMVGFVNRQAFLQAHPLRSAGAVPATHVETPTEDRSPSYRPMVGRTVLAPVATSSAGGADPPLSGHGTVPKTVRPFPPAPALVNAPLTDVPLGWSVSTHALTADDLARSYMMVRPPAQRRATLPVVILLHGRGLTPTIMERTSHMLPMLGRAIAVFPAGWGRSWNAGGCCGVAHRTGVDDVGFLNDVVHQVLATQPDASSRRVYLVGYSNGGRMAMRMVCEEPGMFAGLAAVEAVPVASCPTIVPLPTMLIDSTGDPLLSIATDGPQKTMQGFLEPTVGATVAQWRALDGCTAIAAGSVSGSATSTTWSTCRGQGRLAYDLYRGGSHHWPEGSRSNPSAQSLIARFLFDAPPTSARA